MSELAFLCELFVIDVMEYGVIAMSVRLAGYQPQYFPRLHYFARMLDSDIFTVADYLQYVRRHAYKRPNGTKHNGPSFQAHAIIKSRAGALELGIPVIHNRFQLLRDAKIDYSKPWNHRHLNIIEEHYRATPYFSGVFEDLRTILLARHPSLAALTGTTIVWGLSRLFELPFLTAEDVAKRLPIAPFRLSKLLFLREDIVPPPDKSRGRDANDWLIDQCKTLGADEYHFGGTSACAYMDFERFKNAGIALVEQHWRCTPYRQEHGDFVPNLSIIDLLMNVSPTEARSILHVKPAYAP